MGGTTWFCRVFWESVLLRRLERRRRTLLSREKHPEHTRASLSSGGRAAAVRATLPPNRPALRGRGQRRGRKASIVHFFFALSHDSRSAAFHAARRLASHILRDLDGGFAAADELARFVGGLALQPFASRIEIGPHLAARLGSEQQSGHRSERRPDEEPAHES